MQAIDHAARLLRRAEREDGAAVAIPGSNQRLVQSLSIAFWSDHRAGAPGAVDLQALEREANRKRRVLSDDGRALARDPDPGLPGRVVRISAMLPVPAKPNRLGGVCAVRASIQRIDTTAIVGTEAVDFRHRTQWRLRPLYENESTRYRGCLLRVGSALRCGGAGVDRAGTGTARDHAERIAGVAAPVRSPRQAVSSTSGLRCCRRGWSARLLVGSARLQGDSHRGPGHAERLRAVAAERVLFRFVIDRRTSRARERFGTAGAEELVAAARSCRSAGGRREHEDLVERGRARRRRVAGEDHVSGGATKHDLERLAFRSVHDLAA